MIRTHSPARPSWRCRACHAEWPCDRRKAQLRRETAGSSTTLGLWMLSYYTLAVKDQPEISASVLYRRMFSWIRTHRRPH